MAVKEQDVELIVRQILDQMSGSTAGAAPAAKASGTGIPSTAHVAMLTELEKFEIKEFPMPEVGDDDILVKVEGCGVCGTDAHEFKRDPFSLIPVALGHEGTGEIVKMGKNVKKDSAGKDLHLGDKVVTCMIFKDNPDITMFDLNKQNVGGADVYGLLPPNASVYDGATAAAEGVVMCQERKKHKALISGTVPPYVLEVVETYCFGNGMELEVIPEKDGLTDKEYLKEHIDAQTACVYIQHPNYYGNLEDAEEIGEIVHGAGAKYVMGVNPISLGVIKTPAEYGADVAVGEGQPLGLSLGFGGPYLGFMASKEAMMRKLPGRIVGETVDHNGKTGYVLTLQAREQHIRREKASSNICSNQALCALAVGVYLATMGNEGVRQAAILSMSKAHYFAEKLEEIGLTVCNQAEFFHEFVTRSEVDSDKILRALEEEGILGGYPLDEHHILWCCTEVNTKEEMDQAVHILREVQGC